MPERLARMSSMEKVLEGTYSCMSSNKMPQKSTKDHLGYSSERQKKITMCAILSLRSIGGSGSVNKRKTATRTITCCVDFIDVSFSVISCLYA